MSTGVLRAGRRLGICLAILGLLGFSSASVVRAEGPLVALAFGPALPGLIAGIARGAEVVWPQGFGPSRRAIAAPLPKVRLVAEPTTPRFALGASSVPLRMGKLTSKLREPPALRFERGLRTVSLRPEFRVTSDRRGAFFLVRGSF